MTEAVQFRSGAIPPETPGSGVGRRAVPTIALLLAGTAGAPDAVAFFGLAARSAAL